MSARHWYKSPDGWVDLSDRVVVGTTRVRERAEEGSTDSWTVDLADPGCDLDISGHRPYVVEETDASGTQNVVGGGFTSEQSVSRGSDAETLQPSGRVWSVTVNDANAFWGRRVMVGSDCKRPAETDVARMAWLLSTSEASLIDDTSWVDSAGGTSMDACDYRGQTLDQVVSDCSQASGRNWHLQWRREVAASGHPHEYKLCAWYRKDTFSLPLDDARVAPLYITNDPDFLDLSSGFPPSWGTTLSRDPSRVYSGMYMPYDGGAVYRTQSSTAAAYAARDTVSRQSNVKTRAKAGARALRMLAGMDAEALRLSTGVELPASLAGALRAGDAVPVTLRHMPDGLDGCRLCRVLSQDSSQTPDGSWSLSLDMAVGPKAWRPFWLAAYSWNAAAGELELQASGDGSTWHTALSSSDIASGCGYPGLGNGWSLARIPDAYRVAPRWRVRWSHAVPSGLHYHGGMDTEGMWLLDRDCFDAGTGTGILPGGDPDVGLGIDLWDGVLASSASSGCATYGTPHLSGPSAWGVSAGVVSGPVTLSATWEARP